jgi:hypothetical protein
MKLLMGTDELIPVEHLLYARNRALSFIPLDKLYPHHHWIEPKPAPTEL